MHFLIPERKNPHTFSYLERCDHYSLGTTQCTTHIYRSSNESNTIISKPAKTVTFLEVLTGFVSLLSEISGGPTKHFCDHIIDCITGASFEPKLAHIKDGAL